MPFADHMSRAALRAELKERVEKAAWAAAPGSLEFTACTRTRVRDLDEGALRGMLDAQPGEELEFADLDLFLARVAPQAPEDALRRLRRILRANLVDLKVAMAGGRAVVVGAVPTGGIAGLAGRVATRAEAYPLPDRAAAAAAAAGHEVAVAPAGSAVAGASAA